MGSVGLPEPVDVEVCNGTGSRARSPVASLAAGDVTISGRPMSRCVDFNSKVFLMKTELENKRNPHGETAAESKENGKIQ